MRARGRPRLTLDRAGWGLLALAAVLVASGALALPAAEQVWHRVWPVLAFLLLIKVAADLLDEAGLFDMSARLVAVLARGRPWLLLALFVVLCALCTATLSLDATAVLLTPVAISVGQELAVEVMPFVVACVWLANTASLTLPVANLTNLLAQESSGWDAATFARHAWPAQAAILLVTVGVLSLLHRRTLSGRYVVPVRLPEAPLVPLLVGALGVLAFAVAVVLGLPPWQGAAGLVVLMVAVLTWRGADHLTARHVVSLAPWGMAAFALGLFLVMEAVSTALGTRVERVVGQGDGFAALLRLEGVAAAGANLVNNLPGYLVLEPAVAGPARTTALLVGVNAGPLILPWGSLATLLWLTVCRERGVEVSIGRLAAHGLLLVPCALLAAAAALALT